MGKITWEEHVLSCVMHMLILSICGCIRWRYCLKSWFWLTAEDKLGLFMASKISVAEPHHFYAAPVPAPAPGENFDAAPAAPAPVPAPTLLYSKAKFLKRTKV
jgi:hypothetical protein